MTTWWLTGLTDFHEGAMSDFGDDPDVLNVYQGKIIVLGDAGTGKSSLVKSLNPIISNEKSSTDSSKVDVFSVVEIPVVSIALLLWRAVDFCFA